MKKLKKAFLTAVSCITITTALATPVFAWGGYAHWDMANRTQGYFGGYYSGGALCADIGKSTWDSDYTMSDNSTFANKMVAIASTGTTGAKSFASGWKAHWTQDTYGALANISGGPSNLSIKKGWVDEYLRDEKGINSPIDGTATLSASYTLIQQTYQALDNFTPTTTQINEELTDTYDLYNLQILANTSGWSDAEKASIEKELNRTAALCKTAYTQAVTGIAKMLGLRNAEVTLGNADVDKAKEKKMLKEKLDSKLEEIRTQKIVELESTPAGNPGEFILKFVIKDKMKYQQKLEEMLNLIEDSGFTYDEIYN